MRRHSTSALMVAAFVSVIGAGRASATVLYQSWVGFEGSSSLFSAALDPGVVWTYDDGLVTPADPFVGVCSSPPGSVSVRPATGLALGGGSDTGDPFSPYRSSFLPGLEYVTSQFAPSGEVRLYDASDPYPGCNPGSSTDPARFLDLAAASWQYLIYLNANANRNPGRCSVATPQLCSDARSYFTAEGAIEAFEEFEVVRIAARLRGDAGDRLHVKGRSESLVDLHAVDPALTSVTIAVGGFQQWIPLSDFVARRRSWRFRGSAPGTVDLQLRDDGRFVAKIAGIELDSWENGSQVDVSLRIGRTAGFGQGTARVSVRGGP